MNPEYERLLEEYVNEDPSEARKYAVKIIRTHEMYLPLCYAHYQGHYLDKLPPIPRYVTELNCKKLNIELVDSLGLKIQSSSWLIKGIKN